MFGSLAKARTLFQSFGFCMISFYRYNPFADAVYMAKLL